MRFSYSFSKIIVILFAMIVAAIAGREMFCGLFEDRGYGMTCALMRHQPSSVSEFVAQNFVGLISLFALSTLFVSGAIVIDREEELLPPPPPSPLAPDENKKQD